MISLSLSVSKRPDSSTRNSQDVIKWPVYKRSHLFDPRARLHGHDITQISAAKTPVSGFSSATSHLAAHGRTPGPPLASAEDNALKPCGIARRPRSSRRWLLFFELREARGNSSAEDNFSSARADTRRLAQTLRAYPTSLALRDDADEAVRQRVGHQSPAQREVSTGRRASSRQPLRANVRVSPLLTDCYGIRQVFRSPADPNPDPVRQLWRDW